MANLTVRCTIEGTSGDRDAGNISNALIVNEEMARLRGAKFLHDPDEGGYFIKYQYRIGVLHRSNNIRPRKWVRLTSSRLGLDQVLFKVVYYGINIKPDSVMAILGLERYKSPQ
jgi:hypothetical protein